MCSSNSKENTPFELTIELYVRIVNACIQRCGHQSMNITSNAMVHANDFMFLFMFNSTSHQCLNNYQRVELTPVPPKSNVLSFFRATNEYQVKDALWSFLVNKPKLYLHSLLLTKMHCVNPRGGETNKMNAFPSSLNTEAQTK